MIEAVLFDAVGTLFRTRGSVGEIYAEVAERHGCRADASSLDYAFQQLTQSGGVPVEVSEWKTLVRRIFEDAEPIADFDVFFTDVYDTFRTDAGWRLYPETIAVLQTLRDADYRLGLVSNFDRRLPDVLRKLGLDRFFDAVATPGTCGWAKPDPRIFEEAAAGLGTVPGETLFVGDDPQLDVEAARSAGFQAILIDRDSSTSSPGVVQDLRDILSTLNISTGSEPKS